MNIFKRIFRWPAMLFVTLYARLIYRQGVEAAERRHQVEANTPQSTLPPRRSTPTGW